MSNEDNQKTNEEMIRAAVEEAKEEAADAPQPQPAADAAEADAADTDTPADAVTDDAAEPGRVDETAAATKAENKEDKEDKKEKKFGRRKKPDKKEEKIAELTDQLKRSMAEFDNFRKRTDKEKAHMYEIGAKEVIEKLLPVIDNFERGLAGASEEEHDSPFVKGMDMVYKQLLTNLEELGVKPIAAVGQEFDPEFHNAVMHEDNEELGENVISQELQKGYMFKDTVVRHSMVKVAN